MKELVDALVKNLKIDARQAEGGAAVLFKAARDKMGNDAFAKALGKVNGLDTLLAKAPESGGLGKLFGGFASAVGGGNAAIVASILSGFGKLGLNQEHAKAFVPVIIDFLRTKVGKDTVDMIEKTLRN
jgi:uncharacterized protein YidB (DUF937 family)